jgi:hypothetical protein
VVGIVLARKGSLYLKVDVRDRRRPIRIMDRTAPA